MVETQAGGARQGGDVALVVRVAPSGRFAGTVVRRGSDAQRGFDGWIEFMGAVAELRQPVERSPDGDT